ncbi:MAG TPA: hypothetical protein VFV23_13920 [Verrucomicrobiae bacterium]|nr:hypothetical protein [Verrucomicrobiae bacterium]
MNEDENNLPPTLKPAVEKQQIKIRFKRFLSQGKADTFTASHQHLPYSTNNSQMDVHHSYYGKSRMFPEWYNPTITNNGRGYILWRGPNSEVYIDEDSSTVYLHSVKG